MSLKDAYSMAHSAQCRLQMAASRPDRNLRFVVGHLMHYEALRLRIVEIEHDISRSERASAVAFKGTGHVDPRRASPAGRRSPPPPSRQYDSDSTSGDDAYSDEDDGEGDALGLERFPSGAAQPPRPPPDLVPDEDDEDDDDFDEPVPPEEPDQATLEAALKGPGDTKLATLYNGIRRCPCHDEQDAPVIEKFWELPADSAQKEGVTRAVAQVMA